MSRISHAAMAARPIRFCAYPQCAKPLTDRYYRRERRYCCKICENANKRLPTFTCERQGCGKTFQPQHLGRKYCSLECANPVPPEERARRIKLVTEMSVAGVPVREIARRMELNKNQVAGLREKLGLTVKRPPCNGARNNHSSLSKRDPEYLPKAYVNCARERLIEGHEPLSAMHPISWGAIAL